MIFWDTGRRPLAHSLNDDKPINIQVFKVAPKRYAVFHSNAVWDTPGLREDLATVGEADLATIKELYAGRMKDMRTQNEEKWYTTQKAKAAT